MVEVVVEVEFVSSVSIRSFSRVKRGGDSRGLCGRSGSVEKRMSSIVVGLFRGSSAMESERVSLEVVAGVLGDTQGASPCCESRMVVGGSSPAWGGPCDLRVAPRAL